MPRLDKLAKLTSKPMREKPPFRSEGDQLVEFLDELQRDNAIKEISGWDTGFANLSRAFDGILPGLHLLIGPPACGKTAFAKQLLDQVAKHNARPGIFFTFAETKSELRIKTLARISEMESREIRRGSAYLLHWYGVPKAHYATADQLQPSWEKLRRIAEDAKGWLDLIYIIECERNTDVQLIESHIRGLQAATNTAQTMVVIDDCQRLREMNQALAARLPIIVEQLQALAANLKLPLLAVWPYLGGRAEISPQAWADEVASADVIMFMEKDLERTKKLTEPNQAITLHIVKNRGGEKGNLAFDFFPAFAKFVEVEA